MKENKSFVGRTSGIVVHSYGASPKSFLPEDADTGLNFIAAALKMTKGWQPLSEPSLTRAAAKPIELDVVNHLGENPSELLIDTVKLGGRNPEFLREKLEACLVDRGILRRTGKSVEEPHVFNGGVFSVSQTKAVIVVNAAGRQQLDALVASMPVKVTSIV